MGWIPGGVGYMMVEKVGGLNYALLLNVGRQGACNNHI